MKWNGNGNTSGTVGHGLGAVLEHDYRKIWIRWHFELGSCLLNLKLQNY